jgi:YHS domain-containing protein
MLFMKRWITAVSVAGAVTICAISAASGQSAEKSPGDTTKRVMQVKHLKPQTTCPVMGEPIDKSRYVDYNGKRIYVCCADCIEKVKNDPEKYIKKLESLGQSVEAVGGKTNKESKEIKADTSMKGMKMSGDSMATPADAGYWTCPMHPEIHQTASGKCPICGMNLVFKKSNTISTGKGTAAPVTKKK